MKKLISIFSVSLMCLTQNAMAGVSGEEYQYTIEKAQALYQSEFNQRGFKLLFQNKWDDESPNGYTQRLGNRNIISILGGLARNKFMTRDSLTLVVCSEIGISIGEYPIAPQSSSGAAFSVRGQADYFGSAKCLKKLFADEDNKSIVLSKKVPPIAERLCSFSFLPDSNEKYICIRSAMAGEELANVLNSLYSPKDQVQTSLSTPSRVVVDETATSSYPPIQCRLDSYFAGALCNPANSTSPMKDGYCHGNDLGSRPLCWFKPLDNE